MKVTWNRKDSVSQQDNTFQLVGGQRFQCPTIFLNSGRTKRARKDQRFICERGEKIAIQEETSCQPRDGSEGEKGYTEYP